MRRRRHFTTCFAPIWRVTRFPLTWVGLWPAGGRASPTNLIGSTARNFAANRPIPAPREAAARQFPQRLRWRGKAVERRSKPCRIFRKHHIKGHPCTAIPQIESAQTTKPSRTRRAPPQAAWKASSRCQTAIKSDCSRRRASPYVAFIVTRP